MQGNCNTCSFYATTQAAEIAYRLFYMMGPSFTGHDQDPSPNAVKINFSEEGLRSWYFMLKGMEPTCEQGPSSPVGLLEDMVLDEAKLVPQWRAPNRTSGVDRNAASVQLQPDYASDYNIVWQWNLYSVSVPWATLAEHVRLSSTSSPALNKQILKEAIACGRPDLGIPDGPVIGSICVLCRRDL
ncbi:MAG: hypothetical protein CVU65_10520 [Deltaproteobacteria bacterium HGW-Deltaproteobacteria-22]|jgi:hypothetical protein|nr:MAG: hypothetical protein CVU65_10520 [Deltaproteobacteria bacterium HGW-Deltaproteobacteria-22]